MTLKLPPFADGRVAESARARAEVACSVRRPFRARRAGKAGAYRITISSEGWVDVLDGGAYPASDRIHRRKGLRRRAQERQVRPARPPARASVQRRPDAIKSPSSFRLDQSGLPPRPTAIFRMTSLVTSQCRKCRMPVKTIATSASSATAITSASRTDPPGWITAVAPASIVAMRPSAKGKKASEATTEPSVRGSGQPGHLGGLLGLARGEARGIDPRHLARADADRRAVPGVDDGVRLHMLGDAPGERAGRPSRSTSARVWSRP